MAGAVSLTQLVNDFAVGVLAVDKASKLQALP
jgi:hypothetical protein